MTLCIRHSLFGCFWLPMYFSLVVVKKTAVNKENSIMLCWLLAAFKRVDKYSLN